MLLRAVEMSYATVPWKSLEDPIGIPNLDIPALIDIRDLYRLYDLCRIIVRVPCDGHSFRLHVMARKTIFELGTFKTLEYYETPWSLYNFF